MISEKCEPDITTESVALVEKKKWCKKIEKWLRKLGIIIWVKKIYMLDF